MWHLSTMLQDGGRLQIQNILIRMVAFGCFLTGATTDQWQAQMHVELDKAIALSVDKPMIFSDNYFYYQTSGRDG